MQANQSLDMLTCELANRPAHVLSTNHHPVQMLVRPLDFTHKGAQNLKLDQIWLQNYESA